MIIEEMKQNKYSSPIIIELGEINKGSGIACSPGGAAAGATCTADGSMASGCNSYGTCP